MDGRGKLGHDGLSCERKCAKHLPQNRPRLPINPRRLALARPADREPERRFAFMRRQQRGEPGAHLGHDIRRADIGHQQRLPYCAAGRSAKAVPPDAATPPASTRIKQALLSRTFQSVRCAGSALGVSRSSG
jgi:hypothetical protein